MNDNFESKTVTMIGENKCPAEPGCIPKVMSSFVNNDDVYTRNDRSDSSGGSGDGVQKYRRKRSPQQLTAYPGCDCEFQYRDYTWRKFTEFEPSRSGVEVKEFYVVNLAGKELYTYAEGTVGGTRVEHRFPYLCGEMVSAKKLASAGKLREVHAWVQTSERAASYSDDERPLHVQQRHEENVHKVMTSLPLTVDKRSRVVVFRTIGDTLYIQLMPTICSEHKLIPGTPLFDKNNRGVRAAVGNMFSEHDYIVNCSPVEFCEIPIPKNKHGSDRLRIVCLDRRGTDLKPGSPVKKSHVSNMLSLVSQGVEAVIGGGGGAGGGTSGSTQAPDAVSIHSGDHVLLEESSENELIYNGVVNEKYQITDVFTTDKKNKPPKSVVTVVIDDDGVSVQYTDDTERVLFKWTNIDPVVSYNIMPRRFFKAKASIVAINTVGSKKQSSLSRYKSQERLI